eukprot:14692785-Heterocapsa_arctica.AAC.1
MALLSAKWSKLSACYVHFYSAWILQATARFVTGPITRPFNYAQSCPFMHVCGPHSLPVAMS